MDALYSDGNYIYAAGFTESEGSGNRDALIIKFDKNLTIISRKIYGGSSWEYFYALCSDGNYIYAAGYAASEGSGGADALIIKFDKNLTIISRKIYGGSDDDYFSALYSDGNYIYAAGHTESEGSGNADALIIKFDKNLTIISRKIYGGSSWEYFSALCSDGNYIYAAGYAASEGSGGADALIIKFDKNLNIISRKIYGGSDDDYFSALYSDGNYIYAAGYTESEGSGNADALIIKFDKDLNIISRKIYGGSNSDRFFALYSDGNYIYAAGSTWSEGSGSKDALIIKFDKNLNIISRKIYGGTDSEEFRSLCSDGNYIYAAGSTGSEGSGLWDALILKLPKSLEAKQYEPATLIYQDSNLNYADSSLNYQNSSLTYQNSSLNYQNSNLNYQDSSLTVTENYLRAYVSPEPASSISREKLSLILKNSFNVNLTSLDVMIKTSRGNYYKQEINLTSNPITPGELREVEIDLSPLQSGETPEKIIISPKECPVSVEREIG